MEGSKDGADTTSINAVSSLRSKFENLARDKAAAPVTPTTQRQTSLTVPGQEDVTRAHTPRDSVESHATGPSGQNGQPPSSFRRPNPTPPRPRPHSMMSLTPTQRSPPLVMVDSPTSPPRDVSIEMRLANSSSPWTPGSPNSPSKGHSRTLSRATTPALEARMSAFLQSADPVKPAANGASPTSSTPDSKSKSPAPPPVNRAAKPKIPTKPVTLTNTSVGLVAPEIPAELVDQSASPFSTPPGSGNTSPGQQAHAAGLRKRVDSDASFVQRVRAESDASFVQHLRSDSEGSFTERARPDFGEHSPLSDGYFQPPPTHHAVAARRERVNGLARAGTVPARYRSSYARDISQDFVGDMSEEQHRQPARPELQDRSGRTSPTKSRSGRTSPSKLVHQLSLRRSMDIPRRSNTVVGSHEVQRIPATTAVKMSALQQGFDPTPTPKAAPAPPVPRRSMDKRREITPPTHLPPVNIPQANGQGQSHDDEEDIVPNMGGQTLSLTDFPDSSHASRRPPRYRQRPYQIPTDYDTRTFAVCGEYVCTTGYLTKAWNLRTGEQVLNMVHNENVKVTSMAFKPSALPEDEGKRVWLGTNIGEIHEVDIPSQSVMKTKSNAHPRREIIKMYRHASQLWTLDDGGELVIWKRDDKSMPTLDSQYNNFRVPRGHTYSIACGRQLWYATGKDIRVFHPGARTDADFQLLKHPLSQPNVGEVTAGAIISSKPDIVYFGHSDGKVSIYSRRDFSCVGVINVSLYKISAMAGVGDFLWAGYNTGMAYVYDTSVTPWRVKKDWQAHERQLCGLVADASAIWKTNRLQVVSLGTDNLLKIWDGLLEEDWLESRMQEHDSEYCAFTELTVSVLTWNAGASKPGHLQQNQQDNNFFREFLSRAEPPDIFVFGFQELVDLEDKKLTAKSLFKSKKRDPSEQEHMSHQYRAWRDHLVRCLEEHIPGKQTYSLLHTASMVGLFTCVFVKSALRSRIKNVHTAEVKRGIGGLHGNKGALILRLVLDDSSLCFINCHLAAGQTQTINRNNDIAAILEAECLPAYPLTNADDRVHSDVFTSGGDGAMVLDHEICILNGDLNYRIDTMGRDTVVKHVQQRNLGRLLERDQLLLSRKKNPGFRLRAFQEHPITFNPTYKYNVQTDEYDTSEKRRAPAWCDRVLFRGRGKVKCEEYRRWEVRVSDHRPVSALLRIRVKRVQGDRRGAVWEKCLMEFEAWKGQVRDGVQIDYLTNTFGLTPKEAAGALSGR